MKLSKEQLEALAKATLATRPEEIDCDEWLARVGRFLEHEASGAPLPSDLLAVAQHLEVCPECDEELDALRSGLEEVPEDSPPESE